MVDRLYVLYTVYIPYTPDYLLYHTILHLGSRLTHVLYQVYYYKDIFFRGADEIINLSFEYSKVHQGPVQIGYGLIDSLIVWLIDSLILNIYCATVVVKTISKPARVAKILLFLSRDLPLW